METAFKSAISTRVNQHQQSASSSWKQLSDALKQEAERIIGYQSPNDFKTWFDDECAKVTDEKNEARDKLLNNNTRSAALHYKRLRKIEKRVHRQKKREFNDRTLSELERLRSANESRKYYKKLNDQRRAFNPRVSMLEH